MKKTYIPRDFDKITLKLASPEKILSWSSGEVTKPETINYRTQRSEKGGLFDEKIFGPEKDYECYCGKYKGPRYKGIICEKCGVEITRAIVRRERMGHIELATPVSHIWFLKSIPSRIAMVMGIQTADIERVIYFAGYIITSVNQEEKERILKDVDSEYKAKVKNLQDEKSKEAVKDLFAEVKKEISSIQEGVVLDEIKYHKFSVKYGTAFEAGIGAEAIHDILKKMNLDKTAQAMEKRIEEAGSIEKAKLIKRLSLINSMIRSGVRPEWMFMVRLPVIPPALRPMVSLGGGKHATSDINDLYRRVINRNNRLKRLKDIGAPEVILRNEKRILQEAVDALIDNSIRHSGGSSAMSQTQRRPLKSLADNLKGKQGIFRQNLLGKRVDYSGRSVIVVGPDLHLNQCGLPKHMALELFRPFVISKLISSGLAFNIKWANRLIEDSVPEVWEALEEVIKGKYVLLNRAPTLHRLGIQAFQPILIEGNAIQVHPLVCSAFNADFDGDQMAVHVPLSDAAQLESKEFIASDKNILKPGNGEIIAAPNQQDIILGCYWMTKEIDGKKGEGKYFSSPNDAITAYEYGLIDFRSKIKVMGTDNKKYAEFKDIIFETTAGRLLFNSVLPSDYPFVNKEITKKFMSVLVEDLIDKYGLNGIPSIVDKIKAFGVKYMTFSGTTLGLDDAIVPKEKFVIIDAAQKLSDDVWSQYNEGLLSKEERHRKNVEIWQKARADIEKVLPGIIDQDGPLANMLKSGARGSAGNLTVMSGMKGLIQNTSGNTIEFPVLSSSKEGLTPTEYFITTHGSRKGLSDTALNTAKSGYMTRKLFDVCQDVIITADDCGSKEFVKIPKIGASGLEVSIPKAIKGRYLAKDLTDKDGTVLLKKGLFVTGNDAKSVEGNDIEEAFVRSPMTCKTKRGVCKKCYGSDLSNHTEIDFGEAVGTIAAQSIGEPGTQLTMRTFHAGGIASVGGDITSGLPRVEEIFERRNPKAPAVMSKYSGEVTDIKEESGAKVITIKLDDNNKKTSKKEAQFTASFRRQLLVKVGDKVAKGQLLTDGSADLSDLYKYAGREATQEYIISEITKIYELQGASVARKHVEVIIKQMFSRIKIKTAGDTKFTEGEVVEDFVFEKENERVANDGKEIATGDSLLLGITETSLTRKSFLSAASFQNTTRMLINSSIRGAKDELTGLKENIIIGRLIPAGSGYEGSKKYAMVQKVLDAEAIRLEKLREEREAAKLAMAEEKQEEE